MDHRIVRSLVLLTASTACGGSSSVTSPPPPPPPPAVIGFVAGDGQVGGVGSPLGLQLQVLVTQGGTPLAGQPVLWQTSSGTVSPAQSTTSVNGNVSATWTLGPASGPQTAVAFVGSAAGASLTFNAIAAAVLPGPSITVNLFTAGGSRFEPAAVIIPVGTTVNWVWRDGTHSVISHGGNTFPNGLSSDTPRTYSFVFNTPGTYRYYCLEHGAPGSGMYGVVVVQ